MKLGYNWASGFGGDALNLQNMRDQGKRLKNDLDLLYSQVCMKSFGKLSIPIVKPKSLKLSMKSYIPASSYI